MVAEKLLELDGAVPALLAAMKRSATREDEAAGYQRDEPRLAEVQRRLQRLYDAVEEGRPIDDELGGRLAEYREEIADPDSLSPFDQAPIAHDDPAILDLEQVPQNGRRGFTFLAERHGEGRKGDMATGLKVSPARITPLKRQLGTALGPHGYHGPLGPRPAAPNVEASTTGT